MYTTFGIAVLALIVFLVGACIGAILGSIDRIKELERELFELMRDIDKLDEIERDSNDTIGRLEAEIEKYEQLNKELYTLIHPDETDNQ